MDSDQAMDVADQMAAISLNGNGGKNKSQNEENNDDDKFCSACGKTGDDLKGCNGCRCIRYCSAACQKKHWKTHKVECKKIAKILEAGGGGNDHCVDLSRPLENDDDPSLFEEPEMPDCDICMARLPLRLQLSDYMACCGKTICGACTDEAWILKKPQLWSCAFCRKLAPRTGEEFMERVKKRADMGDPTAIWTLSVKNKDEKKAMELTHRAADRGHAQAQGCLGDYYFHGTMGLAVDRVKAKMYFESAAKGGQPKARLNLGCWEHLSENKLNATRHWLLSAAAGHNPSVDNLIWYFEEGYICHQDLAPSLRARDRALLEMNTDSRVRYVASLKSEGWCEEGDGY